MADDYNYIAPTGIITSDTGSILAEVTAEYLAVFGDSMSTDPNTIQGMLIAIETLARQSLLDNNTSLANQINPNASGGVFLDALMMLTGAQRSPGTYSTVLATLNGVAGTSIPAGALVSETGSGNNNQFQLVNTTVIPIGGVITGVPFVSVAFGEIPAAAGTLTVIITNVLGWTSITNPASATLGSAVQSDAAARTLRLNTLALQGYGTAQAIISGVSAVDGVSSMTFRENETSSPATVDGVPLVANSIYACVAGTATPVAIATALTNEKSGGSAYNNGLGIPVSQVIVSPYSGQSLTVLFDTPSIVNIAIDISYSANSSVSNIVQAVQTAVLNYVAGNVQGFSGWNVGTTVSPFQIAAAVASQVPGLFIDEVSVSVFSFTQQGTLTNGSASVTNLTYNAPISPWIGIATGMAVTGGGVPTSTTVSALVGSTGITLSNTVTVSPSPKTEILTFLPTASFQTTEVPIAIWQQATTLTGLITVTPA